VPAGESPTESRCQPVPEGFIDCSVTSRHDDLACALLCCPGSNSRRIAGSGGVNQFEVHSQRSQVAQLLSIEGVRLDAYRPVFGLAIRTAFGFDM